MAKVAKELWYRETRNFAKYLAEFLGSHLPSDQVETDEPSAFFVQLRVYSVNNFQRCRNSSSNARNINPYEWGWLSITASPCEFANLFTPVYDFTLPFNLRLEGPLEQPLNRLPFVSQCNHELDETLFRRFEIACRPAAPPLPLQRCDILKLHDEMERSRQRSPFVDIMSILIRSMSPC